MYSCLFGSRGFASSLRLGRSGLDSSLRGSSFGYLLYRSLLVDNLRLGDYLWLSGYLLLELLNSLFELRSLLLNIISPLRNHFSSQFVLLLLEVVEVFISLLLLLLGLKDLVISLLNLVVGVFDVVLHVALLLH